MKVSGLTCFYSENSNLAASNTRETALEFHQVVNSLFQTRDIIPFRFPTVLADPAEIASEIEKHAAEYHVGLANVRGRVQIEIRIRHRGPEKEETARGAANSGADYLRARHQRHMQLRSGADALQAAAGELIERWREREYPDDLRCFALIARGSFAAVHAGLGKAPISSDLQARVSGPWPPTEFLKED